MLIIFFFLFFKQKTAYEMRISDWSSDVCSSDLLLSPEASRALLGFRHRTLPQARLRARDLSLDGAQFPWRTIDGSEASGFLPAGAAQHHVDAAVAWAIHRHVALTGDRGVLVAGGVEVLGETARMWGARAEERRDGKEG